MKKIKFIQCGDVHIGMPFSSLKSIPGLPEKRRNHIENTFYKIIQKAGQIQADYLLICGDLFEEKYITKSVIDNINYEFRKIPETRVVIIPGNHDPYNIGSFYHRYSWEKNVFILSPMKPFAEFPDNQVSIHNFNALSESGKTRDIILKREYINIMMFHGTVDTVCSDDRYFPVKSEELERYGFDYIATGHFHNVFLGYGKNKTIHNAGSPDPLGFDEEGGHIIITGEMDKDNDILNYRIHREQVSESFYKTVDVTVNPEWSQNELIENIQDNIQSIEGYGHMLCRVILNGRRNPDNILDSSRIQESISDMVVYVSVVDRTRPEQDIPAISQEPGIRGVFVRNILQKIEHAQDEQTESFYRAVLFSGLEALSGNKPDLQL